MAITRGPVEPGLRDRYVRIESATQTDDSAGAPTTTWATLATEWMARDDMTGRERWASNQLSTRFDTRWVMAYRADMDPEAVDVTRLRRLVHEGRPYDIVSASQVGRKEGIELLTLASGATA